MSTCPICRQDYKLILTINDYDIRAECDNNDEKIAHLVCGHHYHRGCIKLWINKRHNQCPLCNKDITITDIKNCEINIIDKESHKYECLMKQIDPFVWKILVKHVTTITFDELLTETHFQLSNWKPHIFEKFQPTIDNLLTLIYKNYECELYDGYLEYVVDYRKY